MGVIYVNLQSPWGALLLTTWAHISKHMCPIVLYFCYSSWAHIFLIADNYSPPIILFLKMKTKMCGPITNQLYLHLLVL